MPTTSEPSPGSPFAQFKDFARKIITVSKTELDEMRKKEAKNKVRRKKAKQRQAA
jgi:hypothetical protein